MSIPLAAPFLLRKDEERPRISQMGTDLIRESP